MFISKLLPLFAVVALLANALGWLSHRQWHRRPARDGRASHRARGHVLFWQLVAQPSYMSAWPDGRGVDLGLGFAGTSPAARPTPTKQGYGWQVGSHTRKERCNAHPQNYRHDLRLLRGSRQGSCWRKCLGVQSALVSYPKGSAQLATDAGTSPDALTAAVAGLGYKATLADAPIDCSAGRTARQGAGMAGQ